MSGSHSQTQIAATPEKVFAVLSDPRTYPEWLVGAEVIRRVDAAWPVPGSQFHHRIGFGPLTVAGSTTVREIDPPRVLSLGAGMGPLGEASVRFVLTATEGGTTVEVEEEPRNGVMRAAWRVLGPAVTLALWGRNDASLSQLRDYMQARNSGSGSGSGSGSSSG